MTAPATTRYRCPSPAERTVRRILRSPFARDVTSRLHLIPEWIGALAAVFAFLFIVNGLYVVAQFFAAVAR